ncbi:MAG: class I SAM-dependent methyltransferase [Patescibacteria group bacterium]
MVWKIIVGVFLFSLAYAAASGAPWIPTRKRDFERIGRLLDLKQGEIVYELGCGDGRLCFYLAKKYGVNAVGVELSLLQYMVAMIRKVVGGYKNVSIKFGNAMSRNLSEADAVYMFVMPDFYRDIRPKFEKELKQGARVASYVWPIPDWEPVQVDTKEAEQDVYLYIF